MEPSPRNRKQYEAAGNALRDFLGSGYSAINLEADARWIKTKTPAGHDWHQRKAKRSPVRQLVTTPTATMPIEPRWDSKRFFQAKSGRWRKLTKKGIEGSMNWAQEMICRAVTQNNPNLLPTPEACEEFMGFPRGWTNPGGMEVKPDWHGRLPGESIEDAYERAVKALRGMSRSVVRIKRG